MKKVLLICSIFGTMLNALAQNAAYQNIQPARGAQNSVVKFVKSDVPKEELGSASQTDNSASSKSKLNNHVNVQTTGATEIGSTVYDLQTNASVARRVIHHGGGKVSVVWTMASSSSGTYANRGTGYNYFDGTSWIGPNTARFESVKTGWPSIGVVGTGAASKEYILSHDPNAYNFQQGYNSSVGAPLASWAFTTSQASQAFCSNGGTIWGRMAVSGDQNQYVHLISNSSDTTCKKAGVKQPWVYGRSMDSGATWPVHDSTLVGFDSTMVLTSGGDDYAIDARDSMVAIVKGGYGESVTLWKSTNNGASFTKMYIDSFPFMPDMDTQGVLGDSAFTNDGSVSVYIDKNHKIHVAYALGRIFRADDGTGNVGTFITMGWTTLIYWNDINPTVLNAINITNAEIDGPDADTLFTLGDSAFSLTKSRYRSSSLASMPSLTGDDSGNLFIVFSMPADADTSLDSESFRDVWVVASQDNGSTWDDALNLSCTMGYEDVFASVATNTSDGNLHIAYQGDFLAGTALTNNDDATNINSIFYAAVPITKVLDRTAGCAVNAIKNNAVNNTFMVSDNYPDPSRDETYFDINLVKSSNVTVQVTNIVGQQVESVNYGKMNSGTHTITLNTNDLRSGVYFYTVNCEGYSVTKKMVVQK